jgi:uncharacterized OB-fold protein
MSSSEAREELQPEAPKPPMPAPDATTQFFWDAASRRELWIQQCQSCQRFIHYPKTICRFCQSRELAGARVSGRATLYSWTIAEQPFHPFWVDRVPYVLATVELVEQPGLMFLTQIVDCPEDELVAGMPLEVVFEELSPELTVPFFRPVRETVT